jgi:rhodanese-related sulfurtransferase
MLSIKGKFFLSALFCLMGVGCLQNISMEQKVPKLTIEELKSLQGQPDVVVLDVRIKDEWEKSDSKIRGAIRENPEERIKDWAEKYPRNKTLVFYCD